MTAVGSFGGEAGGKMGQEVGGVSKGPISKDRGPAGPAVVDISETKRAAAATNGGSNSTKIAASRSGAAVAAITVVKRNGMLVPFRQDRVFKAIEAAFRAVRGISENLPLPQDLYTQVQAVTNEVVTAVDEQARLGACLTVEGIQDIVEVKLMQAGHYEVARAYILYRDEHKALRDDSPRNLRVVRRDGATTVRFNPMKIASAIEKAFRASMKIEGPTPQDVVDSVNLLTNRVVQRVVQLARAGTELHVELIQDEVERTMMAEGAYQVAKDFIIYRAERAARRKADSAPQNSVPQIAHGTLELRSEEAPAQALSDGRQFTVTRADQSTYVITERELKARIDFACRGFEAEVKSDLILEETVKNFYDGVRVEEVESTLVMAARAQVEREPAYSFVAARLLLDKIYRETMGIEAANPGLVKRHAQYLKEYIKKGIAVERVSPDLLGFDLEELSAALRLERDNNFTFLGLQTLYDRYFIHHNDVRLETPQIFWMRVAMGLALGEGKQKTARAIEFYNVLSQNLFVSSTPTLFNSGTLHSQMSSCYLTTTMDDLKHIFKTISDDAQLSKWAGGLGNDWTNVRATGARIKGTNGRSQGVIPFLKVANDTMLAVDQGGKRRGAMCAYLESWHLDIEDFLDLRKNTGDERRRTHDMHTANWIPDLFMKRVEANGQWTLFSPSDTPDLHDLYGQAFEKRYVEYEAMVDRGEIKVYKRLEAVQLWRKMLSMLFETGHAWITFKDPSNVRSPQDHCGVVHSSNLCTEILLNTSVDETAVCNLGSINLVRHIKKGQGLDLDLLRSTIKTAVRMLDNVIDINFYPTPEARNANLRHRPIGLGIMGFQDALYAQRISYASNEAVDFADYSMEVISYYAIMGSCELAEERGAYESYKGSKWDRGLFPIDTVKLLTEQRGGNHEVDLSSRLDWAELRQRVKRHGLRNSNTMAIAPTATISNITGVSQSIEPTYKHLYAKSNLSGEFTVNNTYLIEDLKTRGLWDSEMIDDLKYFDGSLQEIERIPEDLKALYLTAFEIEPEWLIECASRRQKWIDMGQSLNLYMAEPSGKKLHEMYFFAWRKGLKTTYYLRSLGATQIEKSTMDINRRGLQPRWMKSKSASSNIVLNREGAEPEAPQPKACSLLDPDCEACQ